MRTISPLQFCRLRRIGRRHHFEGALDALAELVRAICDRIKTALAIETENGPLTRLKKAFQTAVATTSTPTTSPAHMRTNPFLRELTVTASTVQ